MHPDSPAAKSQSQQINPPGPPDSVIWIVLSCCSFSHSTTTSLAPPHSVICVAQLSSSSSRPTPPQIGDMYRPDSLLAVTGDLPQRGQTFPPSDLVLHNGLSCCWLLQGSWAKRHRDSF